LRDAVVQLDDCPENAIVLADSGSENANGAVDDLLDGEELTPEAGQMRLIRSLLVRSVLSGGMK
jgi:hypothetical protein